MFNIRFVDNNNRGRSYPYAEFSINGNSVLVIFYHAWNWFDGGGGRDSECREGDAEDLVTLSANYERVIVVGDLNTYQYSEIEPFINAGFVAGNMGYWGLIPTLAFNKSTPTVGPTMSTDNIIVKGFNIDYFDALVEKDGDGNYKSYYSDHYPIRAEISTLIE